MPQVGKKFEQLLILNRIAVEAAGKQQEARHGQLLRISSHGFAKNVCVRVCVSA